MLFFAIKRMNTKIGEAIFILHVQVLFEYQMEKRIKKLCYFNWLFCRTQYLVLIHKSGIFVLY